MLPKLLPLLILITLTISCTKSDPETQKQYLEGYWEIKAVDNPYGPDKDFGINTIVDHLEVTGNKGKRTKVAPNLDGSFTTNGDFEEFQLKVENDSLRIYYTTPFDSWKETVIEARDSTLVVKNEHNKVYTYKRFKKFILN